jgi:hypothetical protein
MKQQGRPLSSQTPTADSGPIKPDVVCARFRDWATGRTYEIAEISTNPCSSDSGTRAGPLPPTAVTVNGEAVGNDPDPRIRLSLIREYFFNK